MNIIKSVEAYQKSVQEILDYFNVRGYGPPDDQTDVYWYRGLHSIHFQYEVPTPEQMENEDFETMYSSEIIGAGFWEKEDYSLAYVNNGCGDSFLTLLDNTKRLKCQL